MHSDASFLSEPGAKRRSGGYHYFSEPLSDPKKPPHNPINEPIHVECTTMKNVLANATEAELGELFLNCQLGSALRISLKEMGHHQPPTPVVTEIATSDGFLNDNIRQRKSRAIYMIFYLVQYRVRQGHEIAY